jgi:type VI secretion system protein ImpM
MPRPQITRMGYFGKVPAAGDFVSRNIDRKLRENLDGWLRASLEQSRATLGDSWLSSFLAAPVWRFLINGMAGLQQPVIGVMIPSVDKVGRYFPFLVVAEIDKAAMDSDGLALIDRAIGAMEPFALSALEEEFDLDYIEHQLAALARKPLQHESGGQGDLSGIAGHAGMRERIKQHDWSTASLWWTEGSDLRKPELLIHDGMPPPAAFAAMLRDPDVFRDFDAIWDKVRHLGMLQTDNGTNEAGLPASAWPVHAVTHPGKSGKHNPGYVEIGHAGLSIFVTDGRFGATHHAMSGRFLARAIPAALLPSGELPPGEADRMIAFLASKLNAQHSTLMPALSFAYAFADRDDPSVVHVLCAGDYLCLHKSGITFVRLFSSRGNGVDEGPTIRYAPRGLYAAVRIGMRPGDRLFLATPLYTSAALATGLVAALERETVSETAHAALQEPLVKGMGGTIGLGVAEYRPADTG